MSSNSFDLFSYTLNRLARDTRNTNVNYAIKSWCIELAVSDTLNCNDEQLIQYIENWKNSLYVSDLAFKLYRKMLSVTNKMLWHLGAPITQKFVLDKINKATFQKTLEDIQNNMEIKLVLLIAFILTGVGIALYLLDRNKRSDARSIGNRQLIRDIIPPPTQTIDKWILVLLITADGNEYLIKTLKKENKVTSETWESVYRATKGLWMGKKSEFNASDELEGYFTTMQEVPENERSEYDVYFVQIQLNEREPKFERGVNSMERADALQELPNKAHQVNCVSPRLSCRTYDNPIFYR